MRRIVILLCIAALVLAAVACDPDPGGWQPTDGSPANEVHAAETYGAEQFHLQLTAIAEETPEP